MARPRGDEDSRMSRVEGELGGPVGLCSGTLNSFGPSELAETAVELEELGYPALWFGEALGREALVAAALLLSATERLKVGTEIANIYVRDATVAKGTSHALAEA